MEALTRRAVEEMSERLWVAARKPLDPLPYPVQFLLAALAVEEALAPRQREDDARG